MKREVPPAYFVYRAVWSSLHLVLLTLVALMIIRWWVQDSNGSDLVAGWWTWASGFQQALYNWIPFPWD